MPEARTEICEAIELEAQRLGHFEASDPMRLIDCREEE